MKISVQLHGMLRHAPSASAQADQFEIELAQAAVVHHALEYFGIPLQRVHAVFVNDQEACLDSPLQEGDQVGVFPPMVSGSDRLGSGPWRIFIGGLMQGSRRENTIGAQDYRQLLSQCLCSHLHNAEIIDPLALHPDSLAYDTDEARRTLLELARTAGQADALVVFVPEASMGTALEMWEAYQNGRPIFAISPLVYNWVIRSLTTRVFTNLEEFCAFVANGNFERSLRSASQNVTSNTPP